MASNVLVRNSTLLCRRLFYGRAVLNNSHSSVYFPVSVSAVKTSLNVSHYITSVRNYAKGKDRKKESKTKTVAINENLLSEVVNVEKVKNDMDSMVNKMKEDFVKYFSLRSSIASLDTLPIEFEGTEYTLQDVAQIGKKTPNMYVVNLSAFPQLIPNVLSAIQKSGLGLNAQQDGTTLFIPVPKITKEHRETLSKNAKAVFIKTRDNLRDVQNKYIKAAKNKDNISEDTLFSVKEQLTKLADLRIGEAENMLKCKQDELLKG